MNHALNVFSKHISLQRSLYYSSTKTNRSYLLNNNILHLNNKSKWNHSIKRYSVLIDSPLTEESLDKMKDARIGAIKTDGGSNRFYQSVSIRPLIVGKEEKWVVALDERIIKTPKEKKLILPSKDLAWAIAVEWESQLSRIRPSSMPLMTLATTALDIVPEKKQMLVDSLLNHLNTDVICVRDPSPESHLIFKKQKELHDPIIKWFSETFQVPPLNINTGFLVNDQPQEIQSKMNYNFINFDDFTLAGLDGLTVSLRSTTLALAVWFGKLSSEEAVRLSMLEEDSQIDEHIMLPGYHDVNENVTQIGAASGSVFLSLIPKAKIL
eukprot:TRINITY_DN1590_c0_g1_i1.p1 TRINITY_DN1590_c0_g1~~TRINITY_DN1590_c0_g1_i1.p1  ORF type:complete len:324 (-),score=80.52 TRINITY_DN1590_c0_g1_i1:29-1000(-)